MSFVKGEDIANRALQLLGQPRITTFADLSMGAVEMSFIYDKVRRAELRRAGWTFSARRMVLRKTTSTSQRLSFPVYSASTAYTAGDVVQDSTGYLWIATAGATGVAPGTSGYNPVWTTYFGQQVTDAWSSTVQYYPGDVVTVSGTVYLAIAATLNVTPPSIGSWHAPQSATGVALVTFSPTGYLLSPATTTQRSAFVLPANYMRLIAQDPKAPGAAHNTVTAGLKWSDWEIEDSTLYSATLASPTVIRFSADVQDVTRMDDMFCEATAARMAMNLNERFSGSPDKYAALSQAYDAAVDQARAMASIEAGSTEDDFQTPEPAAQQPRR